MLIAPAKIKSDPQTLSVTVEFKSPLSVSELGSEPYNPLVIMNGNREKEIHIPGKHPTSLANPDYFGTGQDHTGGFKYYQSESNLPWMLNIPDEIVYPVEKRDITEGYRVNSALYAK